MDDTALADRARNGDGEAYGQLIVRHRDRLFATAFARTGHREDALDVVEEAVVRGLTAAASLRDPRAFVSWMEALVVSTAAAQRERAYRRREVSGNAADTVGQAEDVPGRLWLREILAAVPDPHRTALFGFYFSGMSVAELAVALGRPAGTIKRWLSEARRLALRRAIEMAGVAHVVGTDLSPEERERIEEAAHEHSLTCEHETDIWRAHSAMGQDIPALAVVAKRMDGPCDAFTLLAMLRHGKEPDLTRVPLILLGPGDRNHAFAAWCAGVDCYLSRPFVTEELATFMGRLISSGPIDV
jgi:RNA polymerase sigma-70 factor (ECF subfamily)